MAIDAGNLSITQELLQHEPESQIKSVKEPSKDTALHLAARQQQHGNELMKLLIQSGAGVDVPNV